MTPEGKVKAKLLRELRRIPNSFWMVKEARSLRGYPDIFGCVNGRLVALEVKRSENEYYKGSPRQVLQEHIVDMITESGGYARFIFPENMEEELESIRGLGSPSLAKPLVNAL